MKHTVIISKKVKRILLTRYLLAKLVYELEEFDLRDLLTLFENQLWLEKKVQIDSGFAVTFGKNLELLSNILKQINFKMELTDRALSRFSTKVKNDLLEFYLPRRNLKQMKSKLSGSYKLSAKFPGVPKNKLPPITRIGKGYRDKGSAKNLAIDGSPGWQEVAMSRGPVYHKGRRITNETSGRAKTDEGSFREYLERVKD